MNPRTYFFWMEFLTGISSALHFKHSSAIEAAELHPSCKLMALRANLDGCSPEKAAAHSATERALGKLAFVLALTPPMLVLISLQASHVFSVGAASSPMSDAGGVCGSLIAAAALLTLLGSHFGQRVMRRRLREFAQRMASPGMPADTRMR